ncbi:MAG: hypothetical protein EBX65_08865 [Betaproteobacteria bacterium]|nr:hypothetical protein [Betaproteobacteria bacterium]
MSRKSSADSTSGKREKRCFKSAGSIAARLTRRVTAKPSDKPAIPKLPMQTVMSKQGPQMRRARFIA